MKARDLKVGLFLGSAIALALASIVFQDSSKGVGNNTQPIKATDTLAVEMMEEDFEYALERLRTIHPLTLDGFTNDQQSIINDIRVRIKKPMQRYAFFFQMNRLFFTFNDAHTNVWPSWTRGIPVPLLWLEGGLFVEFDSEYHNKGDRIISIGQLAVNQLFSELQGIVCGENDEYIKLMGQGFLISETFLHYFNQIENDSVEVTLEGGNQVFNIRMPLIDLGPRPKDPNWKWIDYTINKADDLAVLTLNACRFNSAYSTTLRTFFTEVHISKVNNIVLDLRHNNGGNSNVINEFIRFLDVDSYNWYGSDIRYSKYARTMKGESGSRYQRNPSTVRKNDRMSNPDLIFDGELFVLTRKNTFSSANMFAVTIKDNGLGTILGESTGNSPSCFGDPMEFQMPNTYFRFRVSYKYFPRPSPEYDPENTLKPDITIFTTGNNITEGKDAQMEALLDLLRDPIESAP